MKFITLGNKRVKQARLLAISEFQKVNQTYQIEWKTKEHIKISKCQVSAGLVRQEPNGKLLEIRKMRDFSMEWGTPRPSLKSPIFLIFKSSLFSFWRTNLAET